MIRIMALVAVLSGCPADDAAEDLRDRCEYVGQIVTEGKIGIVCTIEDVEQ